jgi:hypothetical protein
MSPGKRKAGSFNGLGGIEELNSSIPLETDPVQLAHYLRTPIRALAEIDDLDRLEIINKHVFAQWPFWFDVAGQRPSSEPLLATGPNGRKAR